jgi:hypothetical protein
MSLTDERQFGQMQLQNDYDEPGIALRLKRRRSSRVRCAQARGSAQWRKERRPHTSASADGGA